MILDYLFKTIIEYEDFNGETDLMGSKWNCKGYIFLQNLQDVI